jgi:hypothetical protein
VIFATITPVSTGISQVLESGSVGFPNTSLPTCVLRERLHK